MKHRQTVVFKVGGSLLDWPGLPGRLRQLIHAYVQQINRIVVLAGGGRVTDLVRDFDRTHNLGDERAHHLAVGSLDLTARFIQALLPELRLAETRDEIVRIWDENQVPILAPSTLCEQDDRHSGSPLPHTWDTTSDSIAARLSETLGASELVLLKSTTIPNCADQGQAVSRETAATLGLVDPVFPLASKRLKRVTCINLRDENEAPLRLV